MNLVTSTSPPVAAATGANRIVSTGGDDDPRAQAANDADASPAFGSILSKQLDRGRAAGTASSNALSTADAAIVDDPGDPLLRAAIDEITTTIGQGAAQTDVAKKAVDDLRRTPAAVDGTAAPDLQAANDLAAQLALVSQWAAVARPSTAERTASDDGLDIPGKLDAVRAGSRTAQDVSRRATGVDVDVGADGPAAVAGTAPGVAGAAGVAPAQRNARTDDMTMSRTMSRTMSQTTARTPSAGAWQKDDTAGPGVRHDVEPSAASAASAALAASAASMHTALRPGTPTALAAAFDPIGAAQASGASSLDGTTLLVAQVSGLAATTPATSAADPSTPLATGLTQTVGTPAWSHEVGQATLRMATNDLQSASLQLNPEHLGPLDVQVRIDHGTAHLTFVAAHAETRQALEASRPALDQLFGEQGLKIGDCSVGDSSSRGSLADGAQTASRRDGGRPDREADPTPSAATAATVQVKKLGLVDTFA